MAENTRLLGQSLSSRKGVLPRSCACPPAHFLRKPPTFSLPTLSWSRHHHQTTTPLTTSTVIAASHETNALELPIFYSFKPFLVDLRQRTSLCPSKTLRPSVSDFVVPLSLNQPYAAMDAGSPSIRSNITFLCKKRSATDGGFFSSLMKLQSCWILSCSASF